MQQAVIHPSRVASFVGVGPIGILAVRACLVCAVVLGTVPTTVATTPAYAATPAHAAASSTVTEKTAPPPLLRTLGGGTQAFYLVEHDRKISIYVDGVPADYMFEQLRSVGGPTYRSRVSLTRPITMSLHRVTWRAMFDRILRGLNVSYHYKGWRISHIRILSLVPGRNYKVAPRPLETKAIWMQAEIGDDDGLR